MPTNLPNPFLWQQVSSSLLQETLIHKEQTIENLKTSGNEEIGTGIFFGTGISKPGELTKGIPIDFLIYPMIAKKLQKIIGNSHIHHLIADEHAQINEFDPKTIRKTASAFRKKFEDVIDRMGIDNYHVYLASEIATDNKYKKIRESVASATFSNEYARLEAIDIRYFYETRNIGLKLSWKFKSAGKLDEQLFDQEYQQAFGRGIISIYTASGRKFADKNFETVPYTLSEPDKETRLIISEEEDIVKKVAMQNCTTQTMQSLQKYYQAMVRLYESTVDKIPADFRSTWEKMNYINHIISH